MGTLGLFIPEGSTQKGDMNVDGNIRIEGTFQGTIICEHTFTLGKNASFHGNVECMEAHIMGSLKGNLRSFETCTLYPTARMTGLLDTKIAQFERGCILQGEVFISGAS